VEGRAVLDLEPFSGARVVGAAPGVAVRDVNRTTG
jgi:hypothetical protein